MFIFYIKKYINYYCIEFKNKKVIRNIRFKSRDSRMDKVQSKKISKNRNKYINIYKRFNKNNDEFNDEWVWGDNLWVNDYNNKDEFSDYSDDNKKNNRFIVKQKNRFIKNYNEFENKFIISCNKPTILFIKKDKFENTFISINDIKKLIYIVKINDKQNNTIRLDKDLYRYWFVINDKKFKNRLKEIKKKSNNIFIRCNKNNY